MPQGVGGSFLARSLVGGPHAGEPVPTGRHPREQLEQPRSRPARKVRSRHGIESERIWSPSIPTRIGSLPSWSGSTTTWPFSSVPPRTARTILVRHACDLVASVLQYRTVLLWVEDGRGLRCALEFDRRNGACVPALAVPGCWRCCGTGGGSPWSWTRRAWAGHRAWRAAFPGQGRAGGTWGISWPCGRALPMTRTWTCRSWACSPRSSGHASAPGPTRCGPRAFGAGSCPRSGFPPAVPAPAPIQGAMADHGRGRPCLGDLVVPGWGH